MTKIKPVDMDFLEADIFILSYTEQNSNKNYMYMYMLDLNYYHFTLKYKSG